MPIYSLIPRKAFRYVILDARHNQGLISYMNPSCKILNQLPRHGTGHTRRSHLAFERTFREFFESGFLSMTDDL